jgi:hypothetical protein
MPRPDAETLARSLGWFSVGLGLVEFFAPRKLARALGMRGRERLVRRYGLRELAVGIGILCAKRDAAPWLWARVAGDGLGLATLAGTAGRNGRRGSATLALAAVAGVAALDVICAQELSRRGPRPVRDYASRSGLPRPPAEMRGIARDGALPRDMRRPELLRPSETHSLAG